MTDLRTDIRKAFDGDDVEAKNEALRKADVELARLWAHVRKYQARLEIDHAYKLDPNGGEEMVRFEIPPEEADNWPDAIDARNSTISLQDDDIAKLETENTRLTERCEAYKGQIAAGALKIAELEAKLERPSGSGPL